MCGRNHFLQRSKVAREVRFHRAGVLGRGGRLEWRMSKVLVDLSLQPDRTRLGRCHCGGELMASLPPEATQ